jgi:predicted ATP-grasp superfamily ATP-dependent carboligase
LFGDSDTQAACYQHFMAPDHGSGASQGDPGTLHRVDFDTIRDACEGVPLVEVGGQNANLLTERLADLCPLLGPEADVRDQLNDVESLRELAASAGMRFPRTLHGWPPQTVTPGGRWLIKKRRSCGGLGIRWYRLDQTTAADELLQQWVAGRSYGATMLASDDDVVLLGACRSLFTRRDGLPFVYAGSFGPIPVSSKTATTLRRLGQQLVATTRLRGLFNVDYLLDRCGESWLIEINPRWSGSSELVERRLIDQHVLAANNSLFELSIQAIQGAEVPLTSREESTTSPEEQPVYLKRIMFARSDVRFHHSVVRQFTGQGSGFHAAIHDIPVDGTVVRKAEPMLTLISKIEPNAKNPMRKHRVLQREIHVAVERNPA